MKKIILSLCTVSILFAGEKDDIEQLIKDITDLRYNYEICKGKLEKLKLSEIYESSENSNVYAKNVQLKNEIVRLKEELDSAKKSDDYDNLVKSYNALKTQNSKLINEVEDLRAVSQTLRDELTSCKNTQAVAVVPTIQESVVVKEETTKPKSNNVSKSNGVEIEVEEVKVEPKVVKVVAPAIEYFSASPFRLKVDAEILDAPKGNVIEKWSEKTSFTSNQKSEGFVKITGYFIDGKWTPNKDSEMWVEESKAIKRK